MKWEDKLVRHKFHIVTDHEALETIKTSNHDGRVRHGYGNTRGDRVTGTGTVLVFGTPWHTVYLYHSIMDMYR